MALLDPQRFDQIFTELSENYRHWLLHGDNEELLIQAIQRGSQCLEHCGLTDEQRAKLDRLLVDSEIKLAAAIRWRETRDRWAVGVGITVVIVALAIVGLVFTF